jgi:putative transposase
MQQMKAHKYRIYPDAAQCQQLAQFFGAKRWIFNHYLAEQKQRFLRKNGSSIKWAVVPDEIFS